MVEHTIQNFFSFRIFIESLNVIFISIDKIGEVLYTATTPLEWVLDVTQGFCGSFFEGDGG